MKIYIKVRTRKTGDINTVTKNICNMKTVKCENNNTINQCKSFIWSTKIVKSLPTDLSDNKMRRHISHRAAQ